MKQQSSNIIKDYYNYTDRFLSNIVKYYDVTKPMQIEFQPGLHCDLYRCPHCYGDGQKQMPNIIYLDSYIKIIDELKHLDPKPLIQFAGINTEPTTHPDFVEIIKAVKESGFICGVHTKGYRLNSKLIDALTNDCNNIESFVTISLDASNSKDYVDVHNIAQKKKDKFKNISDDYFGIVINNIKNLHKIREKKQSKLKINIAYLLFEQNKTTDDIDEVVDLLEDYSDVIRFSIPQIRNDGIIMDNYLTNDKSELLERLNNKYINNKKIKILIQSDMMSHKTTFKKCNAQKFQAVVDKSGNVFPCPQVPLKNYKWLTYGNVNQSSFLEILTSMERRKLFDADVDTELKCRICDRKDESININLEKIS